MPNILYNLSFILANTKIMAQASIKLVEAVRKTALKLAEGSQYQWGHMGSCNCGNLAQELTTFTKIQIHEYALRTRSGDWSEQVEAYCPNSQLPMDMVIDAMLEAGLTRQDLQHIERLSDPEILASFPLQERNALRHNRREDAVKYFQAWAKLLEEQLLAEIDIQQIHQKVLQTTHV